MVRAVVQEWWFELGWGVIDATETPGGCWAHFSHIVQRLGRRTQHA